MDVEINLIGHEEFRVSVEEENLDDVAIVISAETSGLRLILTDAQLRAIYARLDEWFKVPDD